MSPVPWFGCLSYEWMDDWDAAYDGGRGCSHASHRELGLRVLGEISDAAVVACKSIWHGVTEQWWCAAQEVERTAACTGVSITVLSLQQQLRNHVVAHRCSPCTGQQRTIMQ